MYKASVYLMTEGYIDNDPNKGGDGDLQDQGCIQEVTAYSIKELKDKLFSIYAIDNFEYIEGEYIEGEYINDSKLSTNWIDGYDYKENVHYLALYEIYLEEVTTTPLDIKFLLD